MTFLFITGKETKIQRRCQHVAIRKWDFAFHNTRQKQTIKRKMSGMHWTGIQTESKNINECQKFGKSISKTMVIETEKR